MSDQTKAMARQLYQQMCDYVGSNHEERCVEALTFSLDSMEAEIKAKDQRIAELEAALSFYGDPTVYHGIAVLADRPTGGFDEDVSMTDMYDYPKPGKLAREVLGFTPECNLTALEAAENTRKDREIMLSSVYHQYCWKHGENAAGKTGGVWLKSHCPECNHSEDTRKEAGK